MVLHAAAVAHTRGQTFYDVLKADPQHKLIMKAVDADPDGKMKQMLQDTAPVTAFVPVDKVRACACHHQHPAAAAAAAPATAVQQRRRCGSQQQGTSQSWLVLI